MRIRNLMLRWFPSYFPIWLPYAPSPLDLREWNLEIVPPSVSLPVPVSGNKLQVSLHRVLVEAGIALTPATSVFDPRSWFGLYRYAADFTGTAPTLRWYSGNQGKDPRQIAVASEEVATGITCYLLREHFNIDHITDAYAVIQQGELEYVDLSSAIRPDYFCLDSYGEALIAESKGATGTKSSITGRIDSKGWDQVQNVRPVNHPLRTACGRVVIGTHFCVQGIHPRSETTTIVKDPDGKDSKNKNPESDNPIRSAYAKIFRFMGNDALADSILLRRPMPEPPDSLRQDFDGLNVWILGATPYGEPMGIYEDVGRVLIQGQISDKPLIHALSEILTKFQEADIQIEDFGYALPNGIVILNKENFLKDIRL